MVSFLVLIGLVSLNLPLICFGWDLSRAVAELFQRCIHLVWLLSRGALLFLIFFDDLVLVALLLWLLLLLLLLVVLVV